MSAKLSLVTHSAQGQTVEFTPEGTGDRAAKRRFSDSRRADKENDRALGIGPQLDDGERLEDAFLDVLEAVMVFVEYLSGLVQVELFLARTPPRQFENVLDVGANDVVIGRRLRQLLHPLEFAVGLFPDIVGQVGLFETFAKLFSLGLFAGLVVAEFLLDRLHLLAEDVVALRFVHLVLCLRGDLRTDLHDLDLAGKRRVGQRQKAVDGARLEHLLFGLGPEVEDRREKVRQLHRVFLRHHGHADLGRYVRQQSESLLDHALDVAPQCLDLFVVDAAKLGHYLDLRFQKGLLTGPLDDLKAVHSLNDELHDALVAHHPLDVDHGADGIEIGRRRVVAGDVLGLGGDTGDQLFFGGERRFDGARRAFAADRERHDRVGEKSGVLQRQDRDL